MKNKVLLVYAGEKARLPRLPTNLVVLAAYLRENGFDPYIFDTRVDDKIEYDLNDFLAVGISAMTVGLKYGIDIIDFIENTKSKDSNIKFIWGGHHVTFFPEQSAESKYVDIVVRSEGEESFLEVLQALQKNKSLSNIKGINYMDDGKVISNPDREFIDMNKLPFPAYDLVDMDKYADITDGFNYESSRGCVSRCKFCYVHIFHKRKWRAKSVSKVLDEVERIIKEYKIKKLLFVEDNVFVDKKRALAIAQGFIDRKFNIEWEAMARANYIAYYTDDEMKMLKESGWWNAAIGGESGSERMLKLIQKDITKEELKTAAKKCLDVGIQPQVSFMSGTPGETKEDLHDTLDFYFELKSLGDVEINGMFVYTPYPGTPLYQEAIKLGYVPPSTFEEWSDFEYGTPSNTPWMSRTLKRKLETISIIVRFWYYNDRIKHFSERYREGKIKWNIMGKTLRILGTPILRASAYMRWKTRIFYFPYEWDMFRWYRDKKTEIN